MFQSFVKCGEIFVSYTNDFIFLFLAIQAVLQCYSEMIEYALRQRLRSGLQQGPTEKDEEVETERPGTPTDMREIDL